MTAQMKSENEATLNHLAINIQTGHRRCIDSIKGLIVQAKSVGDWLNQARSLIKHSRWTAWVEDTCKISARMGQKYRLLAKHYDALVARFDTPEEWTLTAFFTEAGKLEAKAKKARAGEQGTNAGSNASKKPTTAAFRLEKRERSKKLRQVEKIKQSGPLPVETSEPVENFLKAQRERLLEAIRKFACSKDIKEVAGDLDPVHLGVLLLEGLKTKLAVDGLFDLPAEADKDATDASKPPETASRIDHTLNGREKKAVA